VGGSAAALYARHRESSGHDHVEDLSSRYEQILEAVEATEAWVTSVRASRPSVLTALVQRLSQPIPRDREVTRELSAYKGLEPRWHSWSAVVAACEQLADAIVEVLMGGPDYPRSARSMIAAASTPAGSVP
jgi:hypothetical protein